MTMSTDEDLNRVRESALGRIERSERNYKLAFLVAAMFEAAFFVAFLLLADLKNRTHVLLLISTVAIYSIVGIGLIGLGAYLTKQIRLVLQAIDKD
jgi:hypothetical protein